MFSKILVAVDGSPCSILAASKAGEMARLVGTSDIFFVVAYDPIPAYLGEPILQSIIDARLDESERIAHEGLKALGQCKAQVHTEIIQGPAAEAILEVARVRAVDLTVVGSRGHGQLATLILGSTSYKVVGHATCPVLVVR